LSQDAQNWGEKTTEGKTKEDRYFVIWLSFGRVARATFMSGIALLVFFAIKNT